MLKFLFFLQDHDYIQCQELETRNADPVSVTEERVSCNNVAPSGCNPSIFSRERPLSLTDNQTLIISRFASLSFSLSFSVCLSFSLFSDRSSPLPHDIVPFPLRLSEIAGHSIYISVLFADKRVSMATISSARMGPIVFLLAPPISRLVPLLLSLLLSLSLLLQLFSSPPFLAWQSSSFLRRGPVDWSGGRL